MRFLIRVPGFVLNVPRWTSPIAKASRRRRLAECEKKSVRMNVEKYFWPLLERRREGEVPYNLIKEDEAEVAALFYSVPGSHIKVKVDTRSGTEREIARKPGFAVLKWIRGVL